MRRSQSLWGRCALGSYCAVIFLFLMAPLAIVFPLSLSGASYLEFPPSSLSLRWYYHFINSRSWMHATALSVEVACETALLSLLIGVPIAFYLTRSKYRVITALVDKVVILPLICPGIVIAVSVYNLFSHLRLIGSQSGLVLGHTVLALPFVVVVVRAALATFDRSVEDAAVGLGASRIKAVIYVTLPQIRPALLSGGFFAFMASFDDLIVALFLSGSNMTLPKQMFESALYSVDPTITAVSALEILFVCVIGAVWYSATRTHLRTGRTDVER